MALPPHYGCVARREARLQTPRRERHPLAQRPWRRFWLQGLT